MTKIGFIGAGTVGTALALRLSERGYSIVAVTSRSLSSAEKLASKIANCQAVEDSQKVASLAELIFITTPDDAIVPVVSAVHWRKGQSVVHCNGAASTDILEEARRVGAQVGGFHPLQSFADLKEALENLPGSVFAIEAEDPLYGVLSKMAEDLKGRSIHLAGADKVLYHVAAVITSNYTVTLLKMARDLCQTLSISPAEATSALLPLLRGTVNNIAQIGIPNCLTGPIARGDMGTLRHHLTALRDRVPGILEAYRQLGLQTIPIALARGRIGEEIAEQMRALLEGKESLP
jgi:predicted short-subunit dehydrogenase-like oxidoreductase (DUF2520 family)